MCRYLYKTTLAVWAKNYSQILTGKKGKVFLFADEFSNFNDVEIGIKAVKLLNKAGFEVEIPDALESGRTFLSKGLIRKAKKIANKNITLLKDRITDETPLIGIEPSAILTFRDEYPELVDPALKEDALRVAKNALLFDEFFVKINSRSSQPLITLIHPGETNYPTSWSLSPESAGLHGPDPENAFHPGKFPGRSDQIGLLRNGRIFRI